MTQDGQFDQTMGQTFFTQTMLSGTAGRKNAAPNAKSSLPFLKIYVSTSKTPDQTNSFQTFINPGYRIFIKKPEEENETNDDKDNFSKAKADFLASRKIDKQFEDAFKSKSIYLCFTSDKSFTMNLSCSFPN